MATGARAASARRMGAAPTLAPCPRGPALRSGAALRHLVALRAAQVSGAKPAEHGHPSVGPEERVVDLRTVLGGFNPITGDSNLLVWGSDDEDAVQAEMPEPQAAWEDSMGSAGGLEHVPSWGDYRNAGSDAEDVDPAASSPLSPESMMRLADILPTPMSPPQPPGPLASAYTAEAGFQELPVHELQERLATGQFSLLLDVRSRPEYDAGRISGAVNLSLDDLSAAVRSGSLDEYRERPVAVVCGSGVRSSQATVRLTRVFGFKNVTNVAGGMQAWARQGLPVHVENRGGCGCGSAPEGGCKSRQA